MDVQSRARDCKVCGVLRGRIIDYCLITCRATAEACIDMHLHFCICYDIRDLRDHKASLLGDGERIRADRLDTALILQVKVQHESRVVVDADLVVSLISCCWCAISMDEEDGEDCALEVRHRYR